MDELWVKCGPNREPCLRFEPPYAQSVFPPSSLLIWAGQTLGNCYVIRTRGSPVFCRRRKLHGFRRQERADLCRSGINRIPPLATSVYRRAFVRKALSESCALLGFCDLLPHLTAPPDNHNQSLGSRCPNKYDFQEKICCPTQAARFPRNKIY